MSYLRLFLDNLWRWKCDLPEIQQQDVVPYGKALDIDLIRSSQYGDQFTKLMDNRMIMGYFRYGGVIHNQTKYDCVANAIKRIQRYIDTKNTECLVDAANMLRMEFERPQLPGAYFRSIDDGEHSPIKSQQ